MRAMVMWRIWGSPSEVWNKASIHQRITLYFSFTFFLPTLTTYLSTKTHPAPTSVPWPYVPHSAPAPIATSHLFFTTSQALEILKDSDQAGGSEDCIQGLYHDLWNTQMGTTKADADADADLHD
jgi:hypothetical protein